MDFSTLKRQSGDISRLSKELEKLNDKGFTKDERFWYPEPDKAGNASALIRFLPAPAVDGEDGQPLVKYFTHSFKGPTGKYYIENSLTTFKKPDPVAEFNNKLWNATEDENSPERTQARAQKRKLVYVSNILVISHPAKPEEEGKVFLMRYGQKVYNKIHAAMFPEGGFDKPFDPFDFWAGANFKFVRKTVADYPNYDSSSFQTPSALSDDDEYLKGLWESSYSLKEFLDPKNFKSYDELKARMEDVLELNKKEAIAEKIQTKKAQSKVVASKVDEEDDTPPWVSSSDDDDDDEAYFANMAKKVVTG